MRRDPRNVIEFAYKNGLSDQDWVRGICELSRYLLPHGNCALGYLYQVRERRVEVAQMNMSPARGDLRGFGVEESGSLEMGLPGEVIRALYEPRPRVQLGSKFTESGNSSDAPLREMMQAFFGPQTADIVGVRAGGLDLRGLLLAFPLSPTQRLHWRTRRVVERIAAHLAAAHRLRGLDGSLESASLITSPAGKVLHIGADREAQQRKHTLLEAIMRITELRRRKSADAESAISAWQGLVEGHWSIVDHIDRDGKRFVLARRNEPRDPSSRPIHGCEEQVLAYAALGYSSKLIAYELGLSPAAVALHLKRGLARLRLRNRQELVALMSGAAPRD